MDSAVRLEVRGRVQGVGYRWSMTREAERLGVRGWVRNRRDGSVEALLTGTADAVAALIAWAHHGPEGAVVTSVEAFEADDDGDVVGFEQRPTA